MTLNYFKKVLKLALLIYSTVIIVTTIFWSLNYSDYTNYKGDEFIYFAEYLFLMTFGLYSTLLILIRKSIYFFLLLLPFLTFITSVIIGLFILFCFSLEGTPSQTIYIYSIVYSFTNIFSIVFWSLKYMKKKQQPT